MKRKVSNLIILLLLVAVICGVILYAKDKQLAPTYSASDGGAGSTDAALSAGAAGLVLSELMVENDMAVRDGDGYGDDILMALLEDEWREIKMSGD